MKENVTCWQDVFLSKSGREYEVSCLRRAPSHPYSPIAFRLADNYRQRSDLYESFDGPPPP